MKLVSWNVNRAGPKRIPYQVEALAELGCDIVALQEVGVDRAQDYQNAFAKCGLTNMQSSTELAANRSLLTGTRAAGVLVASRWECELLPLPQEEASKLPWPERLLSVVVKTGQGPLEIHNAYIPVQYRYPANLVAIRIQVLKALYQRLALPKQTNRLVCGDFNLPLKETVEGEIITAGQVLNKDGTARIVNANLHQAELDLMVGLGQYGFYDLYRLQYGYEKEDYSWYHHATTGFRCDHVLAAAPASTLSKWKCRYLHHLREKKPTAYQGLGFERLSDHSALEVSFEPAQPIL